MPSDTPINELLPKYLDYLKKDRGLAPGTIELYRCCINVFVKFTQNRLNRPVVAADFTDKENVRHFFRDHVPFVTGERTTSYRSAAKSLVTWMMEEGHVPWGPNYMETLKAPKRAEKRKPGHRLSTDEVKACIKVARGFHPLYLYLFLFMLESNRRISEVVGTRHYPAMRWSQILWDDEVIEYNNYKGRKHGQLTPLTPELRAILEGWAKIYESELMKGYGIDHIKRNFFVFPKLRQYGKPVKGRRTRMIIDPQGQWCRPADITRRIFQEAGIYEPYKAWHAVGRRTGGNQVRQAARDLGRADSLELAQTALDHESPETTRLYLDPHADYNRYHQFRMENTIWPLDLLEAIPELSSAAAVRRQQAAERAAQPAQQPQAEAMPPQNRDYSAGAVIDFASFRARRSRGAS